MKMLVNVALELYGAKQNLSFAFDGRPGLVELKEVISEGFDVEAMVMRPHGAALQQVLVDELELYDPVGRQWVRVDEGSVERIGENSQLYVFQPDTVDDQGRIPPVRPAPVRSVPAISPQKPVPVLQSAMTTPRQAYRTLSPSASPEREATIQPERSTVSPEVPPADAPLRHPTMTLPYKPKRVVVVFGVGKGTLGEVMVRWLGQTHQDASVPYSYTVIACGRDEQALKTMKTEMQAVHFYSIDILDPAGLEYFSSKILQQHGAPNLILNAVGLSMPPAPFEKLPAAQFDRILDTMVKGTANICRAFLKMMCNAPPGQGYEGIVVNFSSNWGRTAIDGHSAHCAAKWAIEGLSKSIAQEVPPHMAIIPCNPGAVNTAGLQTLLGQDRARDALPPDTWATRALPFLLSLSPRDNGRSLTCPNAPTHHYDNALQTSKPMWALGFN